MPKRKTSNVRKEAQQYIREVLKESKGTSSYDQIAKRMVTILNTRQAIHMANWIGERM